MGHLISLIAFPAPQCPAGYYERVLKPRTDLFFVTTTENEKIPAVLMKRAGANFTIIYSHGNAEDLALILPFLEELSQYTDCNVLGYDYVGYSLSRVEEDDKPSEKACLRSIDAVWRHATEELQIPPQKIVFFGRSIGSGPTVDIASRDHLAPENYFFPLPDVKFKASPLDAAGVLLQSPLSSGARALLGTELSGTSVSYIGYGVDIFQNFSKIHKITAPVAIMHGTVDQVVPCSNGRELYTSVQNPFEPLWMQGKGHNDMPSSQVYAYAKKFIDSLPRYYG